MRFSKEIFINSMLTWLVVYFAIGFTNYFISCKKTFDFDILDLLYWLLAISVGLKMATNKR